MSGTTDTAGHEGIFDFHGKRVIPPDLALTASANADEVKERSAREFASRWGIPYVSRDERSSERILQEDGWLHLISYCGEGDLRLYVRGEQEPFFYHPGLAKIRIKSLLRGEPDRLLQLGQVQPGEIVLDATAGLCTDAAVWAHEVGASGHCMAFESSPAVALVVAAGLRAYQSGLTALDDALRRIELRCCAWQSAVAEMPDRSVDLVYLDPMFTGELPSSAGIRPLRALASMQVPTRDDLSDAKRIARRGVIVKDSWPGALLKALDLEPVSRARRSTLYGYVSVSS